MSSWLRHVITLVALVGFSPNAHGETDLGELAKSPPGKRISYGADPLQFGELTLPKGRGPHPVVINIHGGCWLGEYNIDHSRALANALAAEGIAVWNLEYRRVGNPGGGWPGTFLDVATGADHLRAIAKEHALDLSHVVLLGHSAGGHFALWLAARPRIPTASEIYKPDPIAIRGVVALAPAPELDMLFAKRICGGVIEKLMGGSPTDHPQRYRDAMPAAMLPLGVRQTLVIGKRDRDWKPVGEAYLEKARAAGEPKIDLIEIPDAGHFEVIDPHSTAWPIVLKAIRTMLDAN